MRILARAGRTLALAVVTVFLVTVAIFIAAEIVPSDPAVTALGIQSTEEQRELFRERAHLNDPPVSRYLSWAGGIITGDFGESAITGRPVADELFERASNTLVLASGALALGTLWSLVLAVFVSKRRGWADRISSIITLVVIATPEFVLAIAAILVFSVMLGWFPVISSGGDLRSLALPLATLSLGVGAYIFRMARVSVRETMSAPYIRSAILSGFSRRRIMWAHVMPNAGIVVVNAVALNAIYLISGVIVFETVFSYPGLGSLLISAINDGDIVLMEGIGVIMALIFVSVNILADAAVLALNPKLRVER